jgi:hypothetical protein
VFPARSISYLAYLAAAILFTAFSLSTYAAYLQQYIAVQYSFYFELGMVCGQVLFQLLWIRKRPFVLRKWYVFHLLTISLLGSALLWLFIGAAHLWTLPGFVALAYFGCVVLFMFVEHRRRVALLSLPACLSYTWVLYRILILLFIL